MWTRKISFVALFLLTIIAGAMLAQDDPQQLPEPPQQEAPNEVTGKLVALHYYLKNGIPDPTLETQAAPNLPVDENQPLAIIEERAAIAELVTGETVHLLLFNPADPASKQAYDKARNMIGQNVTITGEKLQRSGIQAIELTDVQPAVQTTQSKPLRPSRTT